MRKMVRRLIATIMAIAILTTIMSVCYAVEKPNDKSIDVWAKTIENGYPNIYTVEVSLLNSGEVQAGEFEFEFSNNQILTSTELRVHHITEETEGYSWFNSCMNGHGVSVAPFEIYRVEDGKKVELTQDIQVTVTLPSSYKQPKLYLLDTKGNAKAIDLEESVNNYTYTISQNGYYVFVEKTIASERGDTNLDGYVTNADVETLAKYLIDLIVFNDEQRVQADYDANGVINNADLVKMARAIVTL